MTGRELFETYWRIAHAGAPRTTHFWGLLTDFQKENWNKLAEEVSDFYESSFEDEVQSRIEARG